MGTVCEGCLASDRTLCIVREQVLKHVQDVLLSTSRKTKTLGGKKMDVPELLLCWECHKIVQNTLKFQERVKQVHKLINKKNIDVQNVECLSTLTAASLVNHYDCVIVEDSQSLVKQEIGPKGSNISHIDNIEDFMQFEYDIKLSNDENELKTEVNRNYNDNDDSFNDTATHFGTDDIQESEHKYEIDFQDHNLNMNFDVKTGLQSELSPCANKEHFIHKLLRTPEENTAQEKNNKKREKFLSKSQYSKPRKRKGISLGPPKRGANGNYEIVTIGDPMTRCLESHKKMYGSKYIKIVIDQKELKELRRSTVRQHKFRVECKCGSRFGTNEALKVHVTKFHLKESGKYICDICDKRMKSLHKMAIHCREHFLKFQCLICNEICFPRSKIHKHLQTHDKVFRCRICGLTFSTRQQFNNHYKEQHALAICDYCGFRSSKKSRLERHILNTHFEQKCKICNKVYSSKKILDTHYRSSHSTATTPEDAYCVECDIYFKNKIHLRYHLADSARHNQKKIPCPECGNEYTRKKFMQNHYNYVHLKRTKYYCEKCCQYFLTGTQMKRHNLTKHGIGEQKKDKLCPHCGRGFSTRAILNNHVRTHTGERPFQCAFCSAAFAQRSACAMHMKKQHDFHK